MLRGSVRLLSLIAGAIVTGAEILTVEAPIAVFFTLGAFFLPGVLDRSTLVESYSFVAISIFSALSASAVTPFDSLIIVSSAGVFEIPFSFRNHLALLYVSESKRGFPSLASASAIYE